WGSAAVSACMVTHWCHIVFQSATRFLTLSETFCINLAAMRSDTTQIRIPQTTSAKLLRLADASGLNKEQLVREFLADCIAAVESETVTTALLPSIAFLRHKLKKAPPEPTLERLAAALEALNAAQETAGKKKQAARRRAS